MEPFFEIKDRFNVQVLPHTDNFIKYAHTMLYHIGDLPHKRPRDKMGSLLYNNYMVLDFLFPFRNRIKVFALIGESGTGKSFRAMLVAQR